MSSGASPGSASASSASAAAPPAAASAAPRGGAQALGGWHYLSNTASFAFDGSTRPIRLFEFAALLATFEEIMRKTSKRKPCRSHKGTMRNS